MELYQEQGTIDGLLANPLSHSGVLHQPRVQ